MYCEALGQVLTRECADLDASHTKPETDMEKKLKLLQSLLF